MSGPVRLSVEGGLAWITLDRPRANVIDAAMTAALRAALRGLAGVAELKLVVFEGAGTEFSFGASVEEHQRAQVEGMLQGFHAFFRELEALGVPTAAVVRGRCLGGGLEVAAWCGRVFAAPNAVFACPEVKLGVFAPVGSLALDWRVGKGRSIAMLLSGDSVAADEAARIGLVDELADDPAAAARTWYAAKLAPLSAVAVRHAWAGARIGMAGRLRTELPELEALYLERLVLTHDANEGIEAFIARRPPTWTHR